jgi:hypothetical protein
MSIHNYFCVSFLPFSVNKGHEEQDNDDSWDTWLLDSDITYQCIRQYYETDDGKNEDVLIYEQGSMESEYDDEDD